MAKYDTIVWTKAKLAQFKTAYAMALERGDAHFKFEGHDFYATYAKYLIQHLESHFNPKDKK